MMEQDLVDSSDESDSSDEWDLVSADSSGDEDAEFDGDSVFLCAGEDNESGGDGKTDFLSLLKLAHEKVTRDDVNKSILRSPLCEAELRIDGLSTNTNENFDIPEEETKVTLKNDEDEFFPSEKIIDLSSTGAVEIFAEMKSQAENSCSVGSSLLRGKRKKWTKKAFEKKTVDSGGHIRKRKNRNNEKGHIDEVIKCFVCKRELSSRARLKVHMRIHKSTKTFRCNKCKKTYKVAKNLDSHTCVSEFPCAICSKIFNTKAGVKQHEKTHNETKTYECAICAKRFHVSSSLCAHMVTHATIKPYKCQVCNKSFAKQHNLRIHTRTHTKEKPFECDVCKKRFTQRSNLNAHVRIHFDEHPYICQFCGRCFTHKSTLKSHLRSHTKEKPYKCTICQKQFSHRGSLSNHQLIHTKEKKFACSYCDVKFAHRQSWNYHENLHVKAGDRRKRLEFPSTL